MFSRKVEINSMNATQQQQKGFTIIEVVLVLAIAGLIFLMIFIAWPALQRNQRDTAKKNDVAVVATALGTWKSNKRGSLPANTTEFSNFISQYVSSLSQYSPDTDVTYVTTAAPASATAITPTNGTETPGSVMSIDKVWVWKGAKCSTDGSGNTAVIKGSSRQVAIFAVIESGPPQGTVYCQEG